PTGWTLPGSPAWPLTAGVPAHIEAIGDGRTLEALQEGPEACRVYPVNVAGKDHDSQLVADELKAGICHERQQDELQEILVVEGVDPGQPGAHERDGERAALAVAVHGLPKLLVAIPQFFHWCAHHQVIPHAAVGDREYEAARLAEDGHRAQGIAGQLAIGLISR